MIRFLFSLFFYVILARWIYAEAVLFSPDMTPLIDGALETISVPTHDKWDKKKFGEFLENFSSVIAEKAAQLQATKNESGGKVTKKS